MVVSHHTQHRAGDCDQFQESYRQLENQLPGTMSKNYKLIKLMKGEINSRGFHVIMLMFNYPG
jgi:hypothetical protein